MNRISAAISIAATVLISGVAAPAHAAEGAKAFDYADYAAALKSYVDDEGMVDYRGLKAEPGDLLSFVRRIGRLPRRTYAGWRDPAKIAFWINAYNGVTLKVITDHYPIRASFPRSLVYPSNSIRQISGVWDEIKHPVLGEKMTLDHIEHKILRKEFNEPRIHMALVCAAMGCPPLRNEPYVADRLDKQFDNQARRFLDDPKKFRIAYREKRVYLSSIFKWFGEDFIPTYLPAERFEGFSKKERAVLAYIRPFLRPRQRGFLATNDYRIRYLDYDWSLNEQE
jgi:hypothetical protein